ncbi:MAG: FAD-binding oxidoreductase [Bryobacterales bacterium]|nr:FAD-binding oxidoreductase [Bryobacterales bacterium]
MEILKPGSPEELAAMLGEAGAAGRTVELFGNGSKHRAGGAAAAAQTRISLSGLDQVLMYEPRDLTVSVGAGMPYWRFTEMLARDGYMVPLDPPFAAQATVGGVVAANSSGPRRRLFGTARDLVIGMKFATIEGKLAQSGGMVVKNVAGLDMGKLLIGSLGTLGAMAVLNFKLIPLPAASRTFLFEYSILKEAIALRDRILHGVLQPVAMDLLNPAAGRGLGRKGWLVAIGVSGNEAVLRRYTRELAGAEAVEGEAERSFWDYVREFTPRFLEGRPDGVMVRSSLTLSAMEAGLEQLPGAVVARAGNGVCYSHCENVPEARRALETGRSVMEYGPVSRDSSLIMWPQVDSGFPIMQRIKQMLDPKNLLNPGRFHGRL